MMMILTVLLIKKRRQPQANRQPVLVAGLLRAVVGLLRAVVAEGLLLPVVVVGADQLFLMMIRMIRKIRSQEPRKVAQHVAEDGVEVVEVGVVVVVSPLLNLMENQILLKFLR